MPVGGQYAHTAGIRRAIANEKSLMVPPAGKGFASDTPVFGRLAGSVKCLPCWWSRAYEMSQFAGSDVGSCL